MLRHLAAREHYRVVGVFSTTNLPADLCSFVRSREFLEHFDCCASQSSRLLWQCRDGHHDRQASLQHLRAGLDHRTTISVFLLWGFSDSLTTLYVFCIMYGLFACCWASTWPGIMRDVQKEENADSGTIFASLAAGKGIGSIASGPLSEALMKSAYWKSAGFAYGSPYGVLIIFTGVTAFFRGCSFVARRVGWL